MRTVGAILRIFFVCLLLACAGCELGLEGGGVAPAVDEDSDIPIYARYAPVKIDIMPLTELVDAGDSGIGEGSRIKVYVSLFDRSGCQIKAPAVFRFELYEKVQRSAEPKGNRLVIWPDVDLTEPGENNKRWRDFLRAYEFDLDFEAQSKRVYVLQVTCLCPDGKRLSNEFVLERAE